MTNEEFGKKAEFILEQQAQFAADIQQLREAQAQTDRVVAQSGEIVAQTGEIVAHTGELVAQTGEIVTRLAKGTLEGFKDVNTKINALVDSQIRTDEKMKALADSQMQTTEDLKSLIAVVGRYFSNGRNRN